MTTAAPLRRRPRPERRSTFDELAAACRRVLVAGAMAERAGRSAADNPHPKKSRKAAAWGAGWLAAREGRIDP